MPTEVSFRSTSQPHARYQLNGRANQAKTSPQFGCIEYYLAAVAGDTALRFVQAKHKNPLSFMSIASRSAIFLPFRVVFMPIATVKHWYNGIASVFKGIFNKRG